MAATSDTLLNHNTTVVHLPVKVPASNVPDFNDVFCGEIDRLKSSIAHRMPLLRHIKHGSAAARPPTWTNMPQLLWQGDYNTVRSQAMSSTIARITSKCGYFHSSICRLARASWVT